MLAMIINDDKCKDTLGMYLQLPDFFFHFMGKRYLYPIILLGENLVAALFSKN
jgi:hypothetical protein